ncbi:MAG: VanW family protein [Myxococcales bacterium]|nr:VanW family protein [Myxococcales bacterium]
MSHLDDLPVVLAAHQSPLRRDSMASAYDPALQRAKEANVRETVRRLGGALLAPGDVFSYHWYVGRPTWLGGYRYGLQLRNEAPSKGIGGGSCQVTNLLYYLAVIAGLEIVERHRHGVDLFPDDHRTVPFGCGATVYYNYADLRLRNPHPFPVALHLFIRDGVLHGEVRARSEGRYRYRIEETDHRFELRASGWFRYNVLWRLVETPDGTQVRRELLAQNVARCLYVPGGDHLLPATTSST